MFNNPYNMFPYQNPMFNAMNASRIGIPNGMNVSGVTRGLGRGGFFKSLTNIKWGNLLSNTQKTLNVINQAIPVYYQMKPIYNNLKSFGKIMTVFNENESSEVNSSDIKNYQSKNDDRSSIKKEDSNLPTFFIN